MLLLSLPAVADAEYGSLSLAVCSSRGLLTVKDRPTSMYHVEGAEVWPDIKDWRALEEESASAGEVCIAIHRTCGKTTLEHDASDPFAGRRRRRLSLHPPAPASVGAV